MQVNQVLVEFDRDWETGSIKTATFTAVSGEGYFCNTAGGTFEMDLPAGSAGAIVSVQDYNNTFDTNALTVDPNGSEKINGGTAGEVVTLNTEGRGVTFVYIDATVGWRSVQDNDFTKAGAPPMICASVSGSCNTLTEDGDYKIATFKGPGNFTVNSIASSAPDNIVDYLVVAGGGSSGNGNGNSPGGGGGAGFCGSGTGSSGNNTNTGGNGGSGGGGSNSGPGGSGNTPPTSPPQGNPGNTGTAAASGKGGGGGGATAAGGSQTPDASGSPGGAGGAGAPNDILGPSTTYAGGGGGGVPSGAQGSATGGSGGAGGGGNAGDGGDGIAGTANTGGGGGGSGRTAGVANNQGGNGGSGIVVVRGS